jgi:hypothetical protein
MPFAKSGKVTPAHLGCCGNALELSQGSEAMRYYKKILIWENNRRISSLIEFRSLVVEYFNHSRSEWMIDSRIEEEPAKNARIKINRLMDEVHDIILCSGINPSITWSPPPAIGGHIKNIDLIQNIFYLHRFQIGGREILDFLERSIGIYERNHKPSLIRTFNPFFYIGRIFDLISELPFFALSKLGFSKEKTETSVIGRLVKGGLYLITVFAALLTVLQLLDYLEPVKIFVHETIKFEQAPER